MIKLFYNLLSIFKKNDTFTDDYEYKLNYLLSKIEKVNLYKIFHNCTIETLEPSLILLYKEIRRINIVDFHKDLVMVKSYTMYKPLVLDFTRWYSEDGYLYTDNRLMKQLLEEIMIFRKKYKDEKESSILVANQYRTEQILRCLDYIIDMLYKKI